MPPQNDDILPESYKYSWSASASNLSLQDYLAKYKPSMVQNDGTKPWIWVHGSAPSPKEHQGIGEAQEEASNLLKEVTEKVEDIKNDPSIPVRSSKKTGAKSKKEVREEVQADATEKLKQISIKHGYVNGKWLIFAPADKVDMIWSSIATSLVSGPLSTTNAYLAKVSTSSADESSRGQHIICVYIPDVYDKANVTEVMKVLLRSHGVTLSGVKSDLYTAIGIDSKHSSGIPSTIWKNAAILSDQEVKELKEAYFAELETNKPKATADKAQVQDSDKVKKLSAKPPLKKKANDDPFGGDEDEGTSAEANAAPEKVTKGVAKPKGRPMLKKKNEDPFASDDEEADDDKKKQTSNPSTTRTKRSQTDDDNVETRPTKKKAV